MQTTLTIDEALMQRLHTEAKRRGTTVSALAEAGILQILNQGPDSAPGDTTPAEPLSNLPTWNFGEMLVDISNRDELYRAMEEE